MHELLIVERNATGYASEINRRLPGAFNLHAAETPEHGGHYIAEVDIILGRPAFVAALLPAAKRLTWVQSTFAGIEQLCAAGLPFPWQD